jgi:hypothetical protein
MSSTAAQRRVAQVLGSGESPISPQGTCSAREGGDSVYGLVPANIASTLSVDAGTELVIGYHAASNTVLLTPRHQVAEDHWAAAQVFD